MPSVDPKRTFLETDFESKSCSALILSEKGRHLVQLTDHDPFVHLSAATLLELPKLKMSLNSNLKLKISSLVTP